MGLAAVAAAALQVVSFVGAGQPDSARAAERCRTVVTIPDIGVHRDLRYYAGSPDDGKGTRIQDKGVLASPIGSRGGVTAGEVGNHFIAGHRTSAGGPLLHLRKLRKGDLVMVRTRCADGGDVTHTYAVTNRSRYIDFFTAKGRAAQIAPVPFHPGQEPIVPMVTLSTCATQEDNARGDRRRDRHGNPPGRWVVVGVLTTTVQR